MKCSRCKREKPESGFSEGRKTCKDCRSYVAGYYQENREQEIQRSLKSQYTRGRIVINKYKRERHRKYPLTVLLEGIRARSKKYGLECNITAEDLLPLPKKCPILGIELKVGTKYAQDDSFSIDRVDSNKGYIKGNVKVISHKANTIKSNATAEELQKVLDYVRNPHKF